ncbi:hypothetical protein X777_06927 [Ooceraea biroi]|uniref:Uncharacterized protein n=1 Tax=Ooceraea biroi TaxID=2015173 RepID=A0A026WCD4_OOCBI|nr:hypothetical protein X777_06927 [Ooceraea biroi]
MELRAISIDNENYSLSNTCAFDSLLQIVLVALYVKNKIITYKMAIDILDKGITACSYKQRAQILISIFADKSLRFEDCIQINCETNVGSLANIIFKNNPSFEEISVCNMGCPSQTQKLPAAQIDFNLLLQDDFYNIIENNIVLKGKKKCCQIGCSGFEMTTLSKIGKQIYVMYF